MNNDIEKEIAEAREREIERLKKWLSLSIGLNSSLLTAFIVYLIVLLLTQ